MIQVFYVSERCWDKFCLSLQEARRIKLDKGLRSTLESCIQTSAWRRDKKMEASRIWQETSQGSVPVWCAERCISQKADVLLRSTYSLSNRVEVWSTHLCSPNTHLKYRCTCSKPGNRIYILCSPTEAKFSSVCSLWSLNTSVVLHQSRTRKSVSDLKSLRFHQKEKDHRGTESNLSARLR